MHVHQVYTARGSKDQNYVMYEFQKYDATSKLENLILVIR